MGQTLMNFSRRRCLLAAAKSIITLDSLVFVVVVLITACVFKPIDYSRVPVLSVSQSGFCQWRSCHTALIRVCDTWLAAVNQTQLTGAVFVDFNKAFDLVSHTILLHKLSVYLQNSSTVSHLKSYLQDRIQCVFLNGNYSTKGVLKCGVPQGSVLGPLLFSIFINDLPLHILNTKVVCDLFADENLIHSCGTNVESVQHSLQEGLNDVSKWCNQNRVVVHPRKTKTERAWY